MEDTIRIRRPLEGIRFPNVAVVAFQALGRLVVDLGERSPVMAALGALHATSDQQLLSKGLTRTDEVRRILGSRAFF